MIVKRKFWGIIRGKLKAFPVGHKLTDKQIKELGLKRKPHLAKTEKE